MRLIGIDCGGMRGLRLVEVPSSTVEAGANGPGIPMIATGPATTEAGAFIAEFYRRLDARFPIHAANAHRSWEEARQAPDTQQFVHNYRDVLPRDKDARILDIGFGNGSFIASCIELGYTNVEGADFGGGLRQGMLEWSPSVRAIHDIPQDIPAFLRTNGQRYDFILLSHVIEHLPKYSLFNALDALYFALNRYGTLMIRTPNMDGPRPVSSRYVTITHETGFTGSALSTLLEVCNFEAVRFPALPRGPMTFRQRIVALVRNAVIAHNGLMHRLFGAYNTGGQFHEELIVTAQRLDRPPVSHQVVSIANVPSG